MAGPRLYFGAEDVQALRVRAASTHRRYVHWLRSWVDAHLDRQPLAGLDERFLEGSSEIYFEETFAFLSNVMMAYLLTEDVRYLDVAREWLRVLCTYPPLGSPYSVGPLCATLAQGLDWLGDALPGDERIVLRDHLAALVRDAVASSYSQERAWWSGAYLHHDYWIPTAGYGIGALALRGEVPEAEGWVQRAVEELSHALEVQGDDGAWHEGAADWVYTLVLMLLFADALRRSGGQSLYDHPWLRETWRYRLYCWLPDDTYVYLNDSFRSGRYNIMGSASCHVLRKLAREYRNPYMQWLAERDEALDHGGHPASPEYGSTPEQLEYPGVFRSPYDWTTNVPYRQAAMHCLCWNVLWYDPTVPATPPGDLPRAHLFNNQGVLLARSGWDGDATVLSFACAPIGGHAAQRAMLAGERRLLRGATHVHTQANAISLFARGRYWIVPPGYGRKDSSFQNLVAVNGGGQLWDPAHAGRIVASDLCDDLAYVLGDAGACYPDEYGIRRALRHAVFLPPDLVVLCDVLHAEDFPSRTTRHYAWQAHIDPVECAVSAAGTQLTFSSVGDVAAVGRVAAPEPAHAAYITARILAPEGYGLAQTRLSAADGTPLLDCASIVRNFSVARPAVFLVVLALNERAQALPMARVAGAGCVGVMIGHDDRGAGAGDPLVIVFPTSEQADRDFTYDVAPARAARHLVVGLTPGQRCEVSASVEVPALRRTARSLRTAEEDYVNRIAVRLAGESGSLTASAGGVLRFAR